MLWISTVKQDQFVLCFPTGLAGLIVIDVVEGTAMDALSSMQSFLRGRPNNFNSLQNAVEWRSVCN